MTVRQNHLKGLLYHGLLSSEPPSEFLIQYVWCEAQDLHFYQVPNDADVAGPRVHTP